jgi:hypothetical protein
MSVHKKLMQARVMLQSREMKKSGHNKFAGYSYFELGDFLPHIQSIFAEIGLCGVVSFASDIATLTISDADDGSTLALTCPMSSASLKGCHDVQNLGAVMTYIRRYLWTTALEIVEHDVLDATTGNETPKRAMPKPESKPEPKVEAKPGISIPVDVADWTTAVIEATTIALDLTDSAEDVMGVFKVNRTLYEELKAKNPDAYEQLMKLFKTMKESFNK